MPFLIRNPLALALALCAAACGEVGGGSTPRDSAIDVAVPPPDSPPQPTTYRGTMDEVPAVTFGGGGFCMYNITLKQLSVELAILPSGEVTNGHVQDLNVESVIPSTTPNCPADLGVIPPNIATYTLDSATPSETGVTLTFKGGPINMPPASLTVELSSVGSAYQARLGFHRTNQPPPLDWSVIVTVSLSAQQSP